MKVKPFTEEEKQLIRKMHETGLKGSALHERFNGNAIYDNIVGLRGSRAISNALTNLRNGRGWVEKKSKDVVVETVAVEEPPKARIGRPPGTKDKKPRKTMVRAGAWKAVKAVKTFKRKYRIKKVRALAEATAPITNHAPEPQYRLNRCPHCGCPLHGAQEGLRTEQELRGGA